MFKKKDGSLAFSWNRLALNMFPNFANDNKNDVEMNPDQADSLFLWQLRQEDKTKLDEQSFYAAGVTDSKVYSRRILKALEKNGVITPAATLDLSKITKNLPNQLAFLDVHRQRKLVGMLFSWEEELVRWRLLDEEADEIKTVLKSIEDTGGDQGHQTDLETALKAVEVKKRIIPSMRHAHVAQAETLPAYYK